MQPMLRTFLTPFLAVVFSFFATTALAQNAYLDAGLPVPTVTSDKDDYAPGEVAHITGKGWVKDQQVHVEFKEEPDYPDYHVYDVVVDAEGNWKIDYPIEERHFREKFTVLVNGFESAFNATTTFTVAHTLTNLNPNFGSLLGGTSVQINISGFVNSSNFTWLVKFGDAVPVVVTRNNNNRLTVTSPTSSSARPVTVLVYLSNNANDAKSLVFTFTGNSAPVLAAIGDKNVNELTALNFTAAASDADLPANTLTYTLVDAPTGASITAGGAFSWTPAEDQDGTYTFKVRVSDGNGGTDEETITVTVAEVNVAPVLGGLPVANPSKAWGETITFTTSATDSDLPANTLSLSLINAPTGATISGTSGVFTWIPTNGQVGSHTFKVRVSDGKGGTDEEDITIIVRKRITAVVYNGDVNKQYSDVAVVSATLMDITNPVNQVAVQGKGISFVLGTQNVSGTTSSAGVASGNLILNQNPKTTYNVVTTFVEDAAYLGSTDNDVFDITEENADVNYSGTLFANTASTDNASTATVTLRAYVVDRNDGSRGDIRNARVTFNIYDANVVRTNTTQPLHSFTVGVVPVNSNNLEGNATQVWNPSLSTLLSRTYDVEVIVNGFYTGKDDVQVTVSKPMSEFVTGGGFVLPANTDLTRAGADAGRKNNFGFNMKYNNRMTNLQGNFNTVIKRNGQTWHVKSNGAAALTVGTLSTTSRTATLSYRSVVIQQIDANGNVVLGSDMGNNTADIEVMDNSEPGQGTTPDRISIIIRDKNGQVWYRNVIPTSSTTSMDRTQALNGGNIQVRTATNTRSQVQASRNSDLMLLESTATFDLKASPNPTTSQFTLKAESGLKAPMTLIIRDNAGKLLEVRREVMPGQTFQLGANYPSGMYYAELQQGSNRKVVKLLKNRE